MSTEDAAQYLDVLRGAVGDKKLTYVGFSYGTLLGATYANMFPKNSRALILDGNVDPTPRPLDGLKYDRQRTKGFKIALNGFLERCDVAGESCAFSGDARERSPSCTTTCANTGPITLPDGTVVDEATFIGTVGGPVLADPARAAGRAVERHPPVGRACGQLADLMGTEVWPDSPYTSDDAYAAVNLLGQAVQHHAEGAAGDRRQVGAEAAGTFRGPWNRRTDTPVLVIGNYCDPAAQYEFSRRMSRQTRQRGARQRRLVRALHPRGQHVHRPDRRGLPGGSRGARSWHHLSPGRPAVPVRGTGCGCLRSDPFLSVSRCRVSGMWHDLSYLGPFDLTASTRFLEGFAPAAAAPGEPGRLRLAFPVAPSWRPAGVLVAQPALDGPVRARVFADPADVDAALEQVRRILSLDVDGTGFAAVGARDPVVAVLRERYPGLRPVSFHSPYEAACWAILSHRIRITQAASIKQQLAAMFGTPVDVAGVQVPTFPGPAALPARVPLVSEMKSDRLRSVARAALDGRLDAAFLRALPRDQAITRLRKLPGIGPFSAELILLRGAGDPDGFPMSEPRLHDEMAHAYGLTDPTVPELAEIAESWRPYRTWVSLLLRSRREEETAEVANGRRINRAG